MTTAPIYAQAHSWTVDDLERLPDGVHAEILDGSLVLSPAPNSWHQLVTARLSQALLDASPPEFEVLESPGVEVPHSYLRPDLAVVRADVALACVTTFRPEDVLLVVDVVSRSNAGFDRREKPIRYAQVGIRHFWRVEMTGDRAPSVEVHRLAGGVYTEMSTVRSGAEETVDIGFPVTLRPADFLTARRRR